MVKAFAGKKHKGLARSWLLGLDRLGDVQVPGELADRRAVATGVEVTRAPPERFAEDRPVELLDLG